jgi:acetylornithine deacetylase
LFSAAGIPALVLGPGHIEQAHVVDEWVSLAQLEAALDAYGKVVRSDA